MNAEDEETLTPLEARAKRIRQLACWTAVQFIGRSSRYSQAILGNLRAEN